MLLLLALCFHLKKLSVHLLNIPLKFFLFLLLELQLCQKFSKVGNFRTKSAQPVANKRITNNNSEQNSHNKSYCDYRCISAQIRHTHSVHILF